ncbi:hypothetical protein PRIPAC_76579 [Pristionchus pacificus]|uniref:GTP cyclohydrolase 1 feedback regulatory protein n=1 Tax=Pristionchus pacificus TaxID=54126 RepID=A0A2A6B5D0_PRIPA|nr:hypothetical protein PRIPAC_76579 [Pristionchus pacificus]|eukprot:PDM61068.1 hypothetical protein PRIPAC_54874 [Pristionchus pacificus]
MAHYIIVTSNMPSSRRTEIDGPVSPHVRAALDCKGLNHPGGQPPWTEATPATVLNALADDGYRIIAVCAHGSNHNMWTLHRG